LGLRDGGLSFSTEALLLFGGGFGSLQGHFL
jgi:hypothetical protein